MKVTYFLATTSPASVFISPPSSLSVSSVQENQLRVSWIPPEDHRIDNYKLTIVNEEDTNDQFQVKFLEVLENLPQVKMARLIY